jgi:hypothetical protein
MISLSPQKLAICVLSVFVSIESFAQQEAYESPAGTKFLLYKPPGYSSNESRYPLLLSLHSKGEVGDDLSELTSNNPEQMPSRLIYLNKWPQDLPFIVLTPQLRPEKGDPDPKWGPQWPAEYIDEVVRYVTANFRVDMERIYVTGMSKGGIGTWTYASAYPEKVAAVIPISGRSDLTKACAMKNIPIWAFHGDGDRVVTPEYSIDMVNAIKSCQPSGIYTPRLNILNARDHNGWNEVYNGSSGYKVYEWLLMFRKGDTSNKKPYVHAGPDMRIRLRDDPLHLIGDFFDWDGSITNVAWKQTAGTPLTLDDTGSEFLKIRDMKPGFYEFEITVTDDKGAVNSDKVALEITDDSSLPAVTQLVLIDGKTDTEIGNLSEGQIIDRVALNLAEINIRAVASDGTASVKFTVNTDQNTRTRNPAPYFIKNQTTSPEWVIRNGVYLICATAYSKSYAKGDPGVSQCYKVTITDGGTSESCSGTGKIQHEIWTGISGRDISSIPVNSSPSSVSGLTIFETPSKIGDNYGSRVRGYICAPTTGNYTFWIASDDTGELWLSTDENSSNKVRIAYVSGWTYSRQWDKYSTQRSVSVGLVGGRKYYIEALLKEASGGDHLAVGWQLPNGTLERPIPGMRLIPFDGSGGTTATPIVTITNPDDGETFTAPTSIDITATASVDDGSIAKVEFYNGTSKLAEDATAPYAYTWNNVSAGNYTLSVKAIASTGSSKTTSVDVSVTSEGTSACTGNGTILREVWTGIEYNDVASIPLNTAPDGTSELTLFEGPTNTGDHYGARVSGYICVPATGAYTFWISSNDHSELWLSTDEDPGKKVRIAFVDKYTNVRQWEKYTTQQSSPVQLVEGRRYYIEALHKEGVGSDHLAVGWQLPNGNLERPIPGSRLSASQTQAMAMTAFGVDPMMMETQATTMTTADNMITSGGMNNESELHIYPNPAATGGPQLMISGLDATGNGFETKIQIQRMTGKIVYSAKVNCGFDCTDYSIPLSREFTPGVYLVNVITKRSTSCKRLLIK